jgi:hypothetical protein
MGRPVDYFIAFRLCKSHLDVMLEKLKDLSFVRLVLVEAENLGFGTARPSVTDGPAHWQEEEPLWKIRDGAKRQNTKTMVESRPETESPPDFNPKLLNWAFIRDGVRFPVGGMPPQI